ncbi:glycosyltransferase family protein [Anoxybacteroides rupiense]|uniref:glycosyltransferase family protein n=1 Tax=Anoxybacteroides rupiense TaxID=311460 RepID=UPI003FA5526E
MNMIIFPPTIDWSWMRQRPQQLAKQLAKRGYTVFYCNQSTQKKPVEEMMPRLYVVHHFSKWVREEYPRLKQTEGNVIGLWCTWPKLTPYIKKMKPDWVIYDCVDEMERWQRYEPEMVKRSNAIICTSQPLFERLRKDYPFKRIEIVRNGYDPDLSLHLEHASSILPRDLPKNNRPLVGYVGAWAPWIDEELVRRLLREKIDLVVIGAEFGLNYCSYGKSNMHFLGHKTHEQLANYLPFFHVCIIPFQKNKLTAAVNPVKAYEYLAAGKPVVSTNLPECRQMYPYVEIGHSHDEFVSKVLHYIHHAGDASDRIRYALQHTWDHRGEQIEMIIKDFASLKR